MRKLLAILLMLIAPSAVAGNGHAFSLSVTPATISAPLGSRITIKFTVTNVSHHPRYIYRSAMRYMHLTITDAKGSPGFAGLPPPPPLFHPAKNDLVLLTPGQSFSRVKYYDLSAPPTNHAGQYVLYFIVDVASYPKSDLSPKAISYFVSRKVVHVTFTP